MSYGNIIPLTMPNGYISTRAQSIDDTGLIVGDAQVKSTKAWHAACWIKNQQTSGYTFVDLVGNPSASGNSLWDGASLALRSAAGTKIVGGAVGPQNETPGKFQGQPFQCATPTALGAGSASLNAMDLTQIRRFPFGILPWTWIGTARGVTATGIVVGDVQRYLRPFPLTKPGPRGPIVGAMWIDSGMMQLLPDPTGGPGGSKAAAVGTLMPNPDASAVIVGRISVAGTDKLGNPSFSGCIWLVRESPTNSLYAQYLTLLPPLGAYLQSYAWAVNDSGIAVGCYGANVEQLMGPTQRFACQWKPPSYDVSPIFLPQLGTPLIDTQSFALGINAAGRVVGTMWYKSDGMGGASVTEADGAAFVWDPASGLMFNGGLGTAGRSINKSGDVVGWTLESTGARRAFVVSA